MVDAPTFWLTGLSASGKSTLANALADWLRGMGQPVCVLDGDRLRQGLSRGLGFSTEDRAENIRRAAEMARLLNENGIFVIAALISPMRSDRALVRDIVGTDQFFEIYMSASLETCQARDPRGLYRRARCGEIQQFTGVSSNYEVPENPHLIIDSACTSVEQSLTMFHRLLRTINEPTLKYVSEQQFE